METMTLVVGALARSSTPASALSLCDSLRCLEKMIQQMLPRRHASMLLD